MENNFVVKFSIKDLIEFFLLCSVFYITNILMFIFDFNFNLSVLLAAHLIPITLAMIYVTFMFRVQVENSTIKVRTRIGKKYQFNINDIKKVVCSTKFRIKTGPQFLLKIITQSNRELELDLEMQGFEKMAEYLLEKYDNGELNRNVFSKHTKDELIRYKDGWYKRKK